MDTSGELHQLDVAHPCRHGNHNLVARIDYGKDSVVERMLGPGRNHHLCRSEVQPVLLAQLFGDGFAQVAVAGHGRIARYILVDGLFGGLLYVLGSVEVGLTHREVDHVDPCGAQFAALLRHGQCGRSGHGLNAVGNPDCHKSQLISNCSKLFYN